MAVESNRRIADEAKLIYATRLQDELEAKHPNQFVAIEPESGEHFLGGSFSEAVAAARRAHPNRIAFVIRIGHAAALHLGGVAR